MMRLEVQSPSTNTNNRLQFLASSVPIGQRGLVHIWGRNDTATKQLLGIHWVVKDPSGAVVEDYEDWSLFGANPGTEHEFIGGRFNLSKAGTYTLKAELLMNHDSSVVVDSYEGDLCIVKVIVPPDEEVPPEKEIPWGPIALVGGGLVLAAALAKPKATGRKK